MTEQDVRNIASVRIVSAVEPIEGADRVEKVTVGGWDVVVPKNLYGVGDSVIFLEIDAGVPVADERFAHLVHGAKTRTYGDKTFALVKTKRLRGVLSQGAIVDIDLFDNVDETTEGDISELIGVIKWEREVDKAGNPVKLPSTAVGEFPSNYARKSDAERVQNVEDFILDQQKRKSVWIPTEKVDGTSISVGRNRDGELFAASRNWEVPTEGHPVIAWIDLHDYTIPTGMAVQGEWAGFGIQKNPLALQEKRFFVFQVYQDGNIVSQDMWPEWALENRVPVLDFTFPDSMDQAVEQADGLHSVINPEVQAEGIVWFDTTGTLHNKVGMRNVFKAINNQTL